MSYEIKDILMLMEKASQLGVSVEIEDQEFTLKIDGIWRPAVSSVQPSQQMEYAPTPLVPVVSAPEPLKEEPTGRVVKSPIVGTFYGSPAPEKSNFVEVGTAVKKGDVLFIIESMKLMNEVISEFDGVVKEILVGSGQPVEFGQPVMRLE